jgi:long-chain acyl-CoA synthetase
MSLRLIEQLAHHARHTPDAIAAREESTDGVPGGSLTYGQWHHYTQVLASRLRRQLAPGSVIILCCPNTSDFHIAFTSILHAGCVAFPISPDAAEPELRALADRAGAVAIIGVEWATAALAHLIQLPISLSALQGIKHEDSAPFADHALAGLLLQSSGTTGRPKIVCRSGKSLDAVAENMCQSIGFTEADRVLALVPLCHSYGLEHGLLAPLFAGSSVHLCKGLDLHAVHRQLASGGITIIPGVPSIYEMLGQLPGGETFPSLRIAYSAGAALPQTVFDAVERGYGLRIGQLYGATEIGSVTFSNLASIGSNPGSVGKPMNGVEIRIVDPNTPQSAVDCKEGELIIRATSMFDRYLDESSPTTSDGFFPTGDLGRLDSYGNLTITGRLRLLIDVGGLKVNPLEVEEVLLQHPGIGGCVVVIMPLSETVFRLKAIVTPSGRAAAPSQEELRRFARDRLSAYKVPRAFEFRPSLPRSPTGKILRHLVEA